MNEHVIIEFVGGPACGVTRDVALADLPALSDECYAALLLSDRITVTHMGGDLYRWGPGPGRPGMTLEMTRCHSEP